MSYFSDLRYLPGARFAYNASDDTISYIKRELNSEHGRLALLHETSHALLGHFHYGSDLELFFMEVDAWHKTAELVAQFNLILDEHYIAECLDSYDRWLSARATCPYCQNFCLPQRHNHYRCFVCETEWDVGSDRDNVQDVSITKAPISA